MLTHIENTAKHGISINLVTPETFKDWQDKQSSVVKNWLSATQFSGKGLQLIPHADGSLAEVVYGVNDLDDFYVCGELASQLPSGLYRIQSTDESLLKRAAISWCLGAYSFKRYLSQPNNKEGAQLAITSQALHLEVTAHVEAIYLTRDLINTPASDMMPEHLAETVISMAEKFGAKFSQIIDDELVQQNYPMIHAVGRASQHKPRLLDLSWGDPSHPKITLVGKGVCFDSGGLDLKPASAMRFMKKDMGGAAHTIGLAYLIMSQQLPVHLRLLIPAVENAVSDNSFRPGDVLPTRKGLSIEIDNTDAEGRLVLCDALSEATNDNPDMIIDFATLTGACRVALGTELPGFFCNDNELSHDLYQAAEAHQDPVWQLPLHKPYKSMLKSQIADLSNCSETSFGGAITAALYLEHFVEQTSWVHFDVMAWNKRKLPGRPIGGEAFGIRAVYECLKKRYANS